MEISAALIAGALIGTVLGFIGAGGAMLSVPILINIFDFSPHQATTAALAVVFLAALSGALPKMRIHEVLYRDALIIWGIGLVTNIGFSSIADSLPEKFISTGFALVLFFASYSMFREPFTDVHKRIPVALLVVISLIVGAITGLFGIGGGFLVIPTLVLFFGTPQNIAAGTSLLVISANSLTALIGHHAMWNQVNWKIPSLMAVAAVIMASTSSHFGKIASPATLRKAFAGLLFAVASFTLLQALLLS
ncbi:MAG: sulfite exporter TauE/SafE family protein [Candidatus Planktophila sp.]